MTLEIGFLLLVLMGMVVLFLTEKLPIELTAFLGLIALTLGGLVDPAEAFTGFSSPAVITMFSVFFVSAALQNTGVAELIGGRIGALFGKSEVALIVAVMMIAGVLSAFMNNVAATAVLLPAIAALSRQVGITPGRLFMPLAFGAILGGTTTLVGTPPNLLAAEVLAQNGLEPFGLFEFAPFGLVLLAAGILFMATVGRRLLPSRAPQPAAGQDLARVYKLQDRLFSIRIPPGASLDGRTLRDAHLGTRLGVQVVAILRGGEKRLSPDPNHELRGGDVLLVSGRLTDIEQLLRMQELEVGETAAEPSLSKSGVVEVVVRIAPGSNLAGRTLARLGFRQRFELVVASIWRDGEQLRDALGTTTLRESDELLVIGPQPAVEALTARDDLEVLEVGPPAMQRLEQSLFLVSVPRGAAMAGRTIGASRMGELVGLNVIGLRREGELRFELSAETELRAGDQLLVAGDPARILGLLKLGRVELEAAENDAEFESGEVGVVEAVIAPRSGISGKTPKELDFRERYGLQVLAIWRDDRPLRSGLANVRLGIGDALLLQGLHEKIRILASDPDFLLLSEVAKSPRRTARAPVAVGALLLMVAMVVTGFQPIQVAAFTAASLVVLGGALRMEEAYRAVEWRAVFLVAALLPVGIAMEHTGAAEMLSQAVSSLAGAGGPYVVLGTLVVLASLLSQGLDGAPTVVLLGPVVIHTAAELGLSPYPLMMGVGLAASAAFMTPFSHKANLLVMGAGGYRVSDYVRVGTPLTILVVALLIALVPLWMPF